YILALRCKVTLVTSVGLAKRCRRRQAEQPAIIWRSIATTRRRRPTRRHICGHMSSVFARSWARAVSSISGAAMVRYAASWPAEDTRWLVASRARTGFVSPGARRPSWFFTRSEQMTIRLRLATRALMWLLL